MHASLFSVSLSLFLTLTTLALDSAACISIRISSPLFPFYLFYPSGLSSSFVRSCSFLDRPSPLPLPSPSIPSIILARVKLLLLHPPFVLLGESPYLWRPPTHPFLLFNLRGDLRASYPLQTTHQPCCSNPQTLVTWHRFGCAIPFIFFWSLRIVWQFSVTNPPAIANNSALAVPPRTNEQILLRGIVSIPLPKTLLPSLLLH